MHHPSLHVVDHPLIAHLLGQARDRATPPAAFRSLLQRIGALLAYETMRTLPHHRTRITTPMEEMETFALHLPITIVPILRAGLGLAAGMLDLLPEARMGHIGLFRDEETLAPVSYYENLPIDVNAGPVLLVDPMLATGGSAVEGVRRLRKRGCEDVRFVCLVAAPEGVEHMLTHAPQVPIVAGALDRQLNEKGYILPGLGDAGDRLYGTG